MKTKGDKRRFTRAERRRARPGSPPGTLIGSAGGAPPKLELIRYTGVEFERRFLTDVSELAALIKTGNQIWLNVDGVSDTSLIKSLGEHLSLHPLVLEDVVNVYQRAKVEHYGEDLFVVARSPLPDRMEGTEQVAFYLRENLLITFQEHVGGDVFDPVRKQLEGGRAALRDARVDYLMYALLDTAIDYYFPLLEQLSDRIESLEVALIEAPTQNVIQTLHLLKQELLVMKRAAWPLREALNTLIRDPAPLIHSETRVHLRDCYDHTFQIIELVETYREICSDLMNLHLSSVNNRMSEVMKVLTIISTIFIPLTFIVGVYGMNFNTAASPWNMPELDWAYGYPVVVAFMIILALSLVVSFRRRGWIGLRATTPVK